MFSSSDEVINNQAGRGAFLVMTEDEQPQSRRENALLAPSVDAADQIRQRRPAGRSDIFQASPEGILETDARLVS
jgi:hypothetical protein